MLTCVRMTENNCVVCFKNVKIYSVGECDHPVCYECSTRMRVICLQNECPMCRHEMEMVVFTERIRPFRRLKRNYLLNDVKHHIAFETNFIQDAYDSLLQYVCKKCHNKPIFESIHFLNEHMKKTHDLYCCDLCASNLKIFPKERRYYTKSELNRHRFIGDTDDRSHRGHPLCEFCNVRYVDRDELYKHLRKEHLFCHICDSEGIQQFYGSYETLRQHYKKDHYLCEEGNCMKEEFTSVFPTEIDLKAHKALVHCKNLRNKQAIKETRTIKLEFTLAPRTSNDKRNQLHGINSECIEEDSRNQQQPEKVNIQNITASWDEAFPSLTNSTYTIPKPKFMRESNNRLEITNENFPALGSERNIKFNTNNNTDSVASSLSSITSTNVSLKMNRNKADQKAESLSKNSKPITSTLSLTWVEKTKEKKLETEKLQSSVSTNKQSRPPSFNKKYFPKLQNSVGSADDETPRKNKTLVSFHIDSDDTQKTKCNYREIISNTSCSGHSSDKDTENKDIPVSSMIKKLADKNCNNNRNNKTQCFMLNVNRKKVKMKPESYVTLNESVNHVNSLPKPDSCNLVSCDSDYSSNNSKVKVDSSENCNHSAVVRVNKSIIAHDDKTKENKNVDKKSKLKNKTENNYLGKNFEDGVGTNKIINNSSIGKKNEKEKKNITVKKVVLKNKEIPNCVSENYENLSIAEEISRDHNIQFNKGRKKTELKIGPLSENHAKKAELNNVPNTREMIRRNDELFMIKMKHPPPPPPGLEKIVTQPSPPPPPGFSELPQHQTFSNQMYFVDNAVSAFNEIIANPYLFVYQQPDEFISRNTELIDKIDRSLLKNNEDALNDFKNNSLLFREDYVSAADYYLYCRQSIQDDKFEDVFVDLIVLLPNILKQQELWTVHQSVSTNNHMTDIEICSVCLQILKSTDIFSHLSKHNLQSNVIL